LGGIPLKDVGEDTFCPKVVKGPPAESPGVEEFVVGPKFIFIRVSVTARC